MRCRNMSKTNMSRKLINRGHQKGFTLVEALVGIFLVGVAVLGLAQMFTYSVLMNSRAEKISNASFLAQQQIESLRDLTAGELNLLVGTDIDELIDVNLDTTIDYRRITRIQMADQFWDVRVLVFSAEAQNETLDLLMQDPQAAAVKAQLHTMISR